MLVRYAVRTLGLGVRPLFTSSTPTAAPRFLDATLYKSIQSMRLSSSSSSTTSLPPNLSPPWQLDDLLGKERLAFETHGDNYLDQLPEGKLKKHALRAIETRKKMAVAFEKTYGPDWYSIMKEADRLYLAKEAEFDHRAALLGSPVNWKHPPQEHCQLAEERKAYRRSKEETKAKLRSKIGEERRNPESLLGLGA